MNKPQSCFVKHSGLLRVVALKTESVYINTEQD